MKRLLLISMLMGVLPMSMAAQDDDLYFVPKKKSVEKVTDNYGMPKDVYYSGSDRSIDEYNRRLRSHYELLDGDSTKTDVIDFSAEQGVYPDSLETEDFELTRKMSRFDDYQISDNAAFWAGYEAGRNTWGWHSPWYYSRYGWYGGWYNPWYYGSWHYGWYDPWYYGYAGWYGGWYDPWYYGYYGWYDPWYHYGWGYHGGYYGWYGGGRHYSPTIGAGSIRRDGLVAGGSYGHRRSSANHERRMSTLRGRLGNSGSSSTYRRSQSRGSSAYSGNSNSSFGGSRGSYGGSRSTYSGGSSSGGGSFSSGGSSRGGGGGGSRMGGRR